MERMQGTGIFRSALAGLAAVGVCVLLSAPAMAQSKTAPGGGATFTPPPQPQVQPRPDFTRLLNNPTQATTPDYPDDPRIGRRPPRKDGGSDDDGDRPPTNSRTGERTDLRQLGSVNSVGDLLALPARPNSPSEPPQVSVLHKLENRMPLAGPSGQPAGAEGRAGALQALENAKPLL